MKSYDKYDKFKDFIYHELGLSISDSNFANILRYIEKRARELKMDLQSFYNYILKDEGERQNFINISTICETYFFREERQFSVIEKYILPKIIKNKTKLNFWSVTCGGGEEAISLALIVKSMLSFYPDKQLTVYGTDINSEALNKCKTFTYRKNSLRTDGNCFSHLIDEYFYKENEKWKLKDEIKKYLKIKKINIYKDNLEIIPNHLDIIFFRNTLIYMEEKNKKYLIDKIINKLRVGGYLFLGTTEVAFISHKNLLLQENDSVYYFKKVNY